MKKCKWLTEEGWCELRDGIADDDSCDGAEATMWECNYVADEVIADYLGVNNQKGA